MEPMERNRPLKACPDMSCRRLRTCHGLAPRRTCLKTHYRNNDEFYDYMTAKINRLCRGAKDDPNDTRSEDELLAEMYKILQEREREFDAMEANQRAGQKH
jgi:hypothetical protein